MGAGAGDFTAVHWPPQSGNDFTTTLAMAVNSDLKRSVGSNRPASSGWSSPLPRLAFVSILFTSPIWAEAGPVTGTELTPPSTIGQEGSAKLDKGLTGVTAETDSDEHPRPLAAPERGGSAAASGSGRTAAELAADMLREAGIGSAASAAEGLSPARQTRQMGKQPPSPRTGGQPTSKDFEADAEPLGELRDLGKAAMHWIKDSIPWLRSDGSDSPVQPTSGQIEWSGSPAGVGPAVRQAVPGTAPAMDSPAGPNASPSPGPYDDRARKEAIQSERDVIRDFIRYLREILQHPMTWLVIALFMIGGIAMSIADRRPK